MEELQELMGRAVGIGVIRWAKVMSNTANYHTY